MTPLVPLAGLGMGLVLGVFGAGGSIVAVPVFVYLLGREVEQAIVMSLIVVGFASLAGAARSWRAGQVRLRPALQFGAVAMLGAYGGARAAALVSDAVQMTVFAVAVLSAALLMLRGGAADARSAADGSSAPPSRPSATLVLTALGVGGITGLVGVGGGFLVVPALVLLTGVPMGTAVGTSLVVIAMNAAAALAGYIGRVDPPWTVLGWVTAAAVIGVMVGNRLGRSLPQPALRRAFATFLLLVGGFVLYENRTHPAARAPEPHTVAPAARG
jgi:uncharacterized membrane protein YfcA